MKNPGARISIGGNELKRKKGGGHSSILPESSCFL
jgi:hypothetical protein